MEITPGGFPFLRAIVNGITGMEAAIFKWIITMGVAIKSSDWIYKIKGLMSSWYYIIDRDWCLINTFLIIIN